MKTAMACLVASAVLGVGGAPCAHAQPLPPVTYQLNPVATYLKHPAAPVAMPLVIDLATISAAPGDCLEFTVNGSFQCQMPSNPGCVTKSCAVIFSANNTVLAPSQLVRVPGAVDAILSLVMAPLCGPNGSGPTDIPFDFRVDLPGGGVGGAALAKVPQTAAYLIVGSADCYNSDNLDSDGDFEVVITVIKHTACPADIAPAICTDNIVDVDDLLAVINAWGACPSPPAACPADVNASGNVDVDDLLAVINAWGACP